MTGIQPNQSDKITQALADRGVSYQLENNGTALAVEKSQVGDARVALANAGVNAGSGTQPGMELLDSQKLGASDFQQRVTYQRALEGEIANTIGQINGVNGAQVQLTLPEDKLFSDDSNPATAAVLLSGTASLVRIMRANMLDEINKPYVTTARAKGLSEFQLLLKYPVRVALNPFISTIAWLLPNLVSGSIVVAIVLNLPTAAPLLLESLMAQDMYLAGAFVLLICALTLVGSLVSDILLALVDPRIRLE